MNVSLYQAAAAMNATARWQDMISENLAASSVPGSRKQDVTFSSIEAGMPSGTLGLNGQRFSIPSARTGTNFSQGQMLPTGVATDFAIDGPGFFQVQLPSGDTGFTRNGTFQLNAQGQLVTQQGYPVASESGGPLQLDPTNPAPMTVSASGDVTQGNEARGKIRMAEFADQHQLTVMGGGYFLNGNPAVKPESAKISQLRQGFIEQGNSSPTTEMAGLITAMRLFESNQKVLQMQDDRMGRVITDLGGTGQ
ncbi:MAG TPA: flagellar hook-basal body protein [Verrucomicrobiae bacterium]|jgi:flagellar basal-body rod protein FlgG|nr:flagellar hook-basal body protein [Verrucomicrobiae bacterium]